MRTTKVLAGDERTHDVLDFTLNENDVAAKHPSSVPTAGTARASAVDAFLADAARAPVVAASGRGRLIFAMDATMSRQPAWDLAVSLQGRMFDTAAAIGGLDVQLVYFRGLSECRASRWISDGKGLSAVMGRIAVAGGRTQLERVLRHARDETARARVGALVYVGDAFEEALDQVCGLAGELALRGLKAFMFHEGEDTSAGRAFREIARLTGGSYAAFDRSAPERLAALLAAAAAYAAGGLSALEALARDRNGEAAQKLLSQLR